MTSKVISHEKDYCGIVFICGGSSWAWASTPEDAAIKAAKCAKRDWKAYFKFKRQQDFNVVVLDMRNRNGWFADHRGIFDTDTKTLIPDEEITEHKVVV
jgi:hypothetical protein